MKTNFIVCFVVAFVFAFGVAAQETPGVIRNESTSKLASVGVGLGHPSGLALTIEKITESFVPILSSQSNCFWKANGPSNPATCEAGVGTTDASLLTSGTLDAARLPAVATRNDTASTIAAQKIFTVVPRLPLTGYVKANGIGADPTASSSIPATDLSDIGASPIAPHVATNAALVATPTALYAKGVWRDDVVAGRGAGPMWFTPLATDCATAGLANDGASCRNSSDGKAWRGWFDASGVNILQFGADPTQTNDSTAEIQAAITVACNNNMRQLRGPAGKYKFTNLTIACDQFQALGDGQKKSILFTTSLSGNAIHVGAAGVAHNNVTFKGISVSAVLASTRTDATFYVEDVNTFYMNDFTIFGGDVCLQVEGTGGSSRSYNTVFTRGVVSSCRANVVLGSLMNGGDGAAGVHLNETQISAATEIGLDQVGGKGLVLNNVEFTANAAAWRVRPGTNQLTGATSCNYVNVNGSTGDGFLLQPTGGGIIADFRCLNFFANTNGGHGVVFDGTATNLKNILIGTGAIGNNGKHGVWVKGGKWIKIDADIHQNNVTNSSACAGVQCDGLHLDAGVEAFEFTGHSGGGGLFTPNLQRYGAACDGGAGQNVKIDGSFDGNVTGGTSCPVVGPGALVHDRNSTLGKYDLKSPSISLEGRVKIRDMFTCTMVAGACSAQTLGTTYAAAPKCFATWTGTGALTGLLSAPSTTTTVTPASSVGSDTAQVNVLCLGN